MPEIGRLVAIIDGDLSGLERALNNAQKTLNRAGNQMTSAGRALSLGVTAPIVAIGGLAIKASMDFETAFAGVRKTVDATAPEFDNLRKGIIDMSKEMPMAASEIAKVVETAGQLGIKTSGLLEFAKTMVMVGKTTDISAEEAATGFAHLANIMQLPQEEIKNLASGFVMLSNEGASTGAQIIDMAERIAGAGHAVGLTAPQVLAFSAGLADLGINAEAGGSAFSRLLITMSNAASGIGPSEEALKRISDAQLEVRDASENMVQAQRGVRDAFEGVQSAQRGVRDAYEGVTTAQRGLRDATEAVTQAQRSVRDATEGVGAAQRSTRNATESLSDAQRTLTRLYRDQHQASLDARRETLSVAEAYQGLKEVQAQAGSHSLELRDAQLSLAQAHKQESEAAKKGGLEKQQASLAVEQAQQRLNQVQAQGGRYALDLQNAQLRLAEAQQRVGKSVEAYRDQYEQAQRSVRNATEGVKDAQRSQRNASEALQTSQKGLRNATEGVTDAQRNLRNANEGVSTSQIALRNASEGVGDAQLSARDAAEKLAAAQDKLTLANAQAYGTLQTFADVAGMLPEDFAALFKSNPAEAITKFVEGLKKAQAEGSNLFKIFEKLDITNIRQIDELLRMAVGQVDFGKKIESTNKAVQDGTYLTDKYGEVTKTTAAQLQIMRNRVNANMIALGDELTPVLLQVTQDMGPMLAAFASLTALFAAMPGPVQTAVIAFFGFSAALGPSLFGLGQMFKMTKDVMMLMRSTAMLKAFAVMRTGFMSIGTALLTPPLGIIIALIALGVAIYIFRDDIWKVLKPALDWAAKAFGKVSEAVTDGLGGALGFVKSHWREIATLLAGPFAPIVALATDAFGIRSALEGALTSLIDTAGGLASSIAGAIASAFTGAVGIISAAIGTIVSTIEGNFNAETMGRALGFYLFLPVRIFRTAFENVLPVLTTFFGSTLPNFFTRAIPAVASAAATLGKAIVTGIVNAIKAIPGFIANAATAVASTAIGLGKAVMNGILTGLTTYLGLVKTFWLTTLPGVITGAQQTIISAALAVGKAMITAVSTGITGSLNLIKSAPGVIRDAFVNAFNAMLSSFKSIGRMIVEGVWQGIKDAKDWFYNQIKSFFSGLVKSAKSALGIKSPSTVFAEIGGNVVKGLALGLEGAKDLTVAMPQMAKMPMVQMPTYNQQPAYAGVSTSTGDGGGTTAQAEIAGKPGLYMEINGPIKIINTKIRRDANGALGDLAFGVKGQLNRRGVYA